MKVYFYLVRGQVFNLALPGKDIIPHLTAGDVIEVDEAGHEYLQSPAGQGLPMVLSGETFRGTEEEYQAYLAGKQAPPPANPVDEFLQQVVEEDLAAASEAEATGEEEPLAGGIPPAGSRVQVVLKFLRQLEERNLEPAELNPILDEVTSRFSSPRVQQEVQRLRDKQVAVE